MTEPRKIHEVEVIRTSERDAEGAPAQDSHVVQHVEARRIPGGAFFGQSRFSFSGDPEAARQRLREVKLRMWLWLLGLAGISAGCFYGAWAVESKLFGAFFIFAGALISVAAGVVWLILRAMRRLSL